jgi:polyisoprenoid-binding protein YceI
MSLRIPVAALHSGESGLDKNARKALAADRFPAIAFRSTSILATPAGGGAFALRIAGTLAIAGQTRAITFDARAVPAGGGLRIVGAVPLRMTDYGIKPPRFMGMMKVADPVQVAFDLTVAR